MVKRYIPKRGDVIWTDFNPEAGHEQTGKIAAIVLSPFVFNQKILLALVAPIARRIRGHGFEVGLNGKKISGAVLCHQVKTIDFVERGSLYVEKAPIQVISEVLAKVKTIVDEQVV